MLTFRGSGVDIDRQASTGIVREMPAIEFRQVRDSECPAERLLKNSDTVRGGCAEISIYIQKSHDHPKLL